MDLAGAKPAGPSKGLVDDLRTKETKVVEKDLGVNRDNELRTKVDVKLQTKGLSGAQKWRAALEKIEEDELDVSAEKERVWEGPEAKEVRAP